MVVDGRCEAYGWDDGSRAELERDKVQIILEMLVAASDQRAAGLEANALAAFLVAAERARDLLAERS